MSEPAAGRGRFSFSLRTLLLVLLVGVVIASHMLTSYRLREARRTIAGLRRSVGELDVQDRGQAHVIALEAGEPSLWRWRLFLPQGASYTWHLAAGQIPPSGLPTAIPMSGSVNVREGEDQLLATVRVKQGQDGVWTCSVNFGAADEGWNRGGAAQTIPGVDFSWMHWDQLGSDGTEAVPAGQPIELLRVRAAGLKESSPISTSQPALGLMFWLEPH